MTIFEMTNIILGVLLVFAGAYTIARGETRWVFKKVTRVRQSDTFWFVVAMQFAGGLFLLSTSVIRLIGR